MLVASCLQLTSLQWEPKRTDIHLYCVFCAGLKTHTFCRNSQTWGKKLSHIVFMLKRQISDRVALQPYRHDASALAQSCIFTGTIADYPRSCVCILSQVTRGPLARKVYKHLTHLHLAIAQTSKNHNCLPRRKVRLEQQLLSVGPPPEQDRSDKRGKGKGRWDRTQGVIIV